MNKRYIRGFFGAALSAFGTVWPAATWGRHWLVLPGALLGWLIGQYGDYFLRGMFAAWQQVACWYTQERRPWSKVRLSIQRHAGVAFENSARSAKHRLAQVREVRTWWNKHMADVRREWYRKTRLIDAVEVIRTAVEASCTVLVLGVLVWFSHRNGPSSYAV